tara:strand:+ start:79 stop:342 length:264 start_codon:yes stop_codon:yes gene_type:complete
MRANFLHIKSYGNTPSQGARIRHINSLTEKIDKDIMINDGYNQGRTHSIMAKITIFRGRFIVGYSHPQPVWREDEGKISSSALAVVT